MKIKNIYKIILLSCIALACDDNLEITQSSSVIPEDYLKEESQLDSYIINRYTDLPNAGGGVGLDLSLIHIFFRHHRALSCCYRINRPPATDRLKSCLLYTSFRVTPQAET